MALKKNPGPLLTSKFKGLIDVIPLKWRSKLGLTSLVREQPVDVAPTALGDITADGVRVVSSVDQSRTDERKKTDVFLTNPVGSQLIEYYRTPEGQIATRTRTVVDEGDALPAIDELTIEAAQDAWGNDQAEQIVSTVEEVFPGAVYGKTLENLIPPKFRASIPTRVHEYTTAGQVVTDPAFATGEISHEEQQIEVDRKRVKSVSITTSVPVTKVDWETSEEYGGGTLGILYVLDITANLQVTDLDSGVDVVSSKITDLGNGYSILETHQKYVPPWPELDGQDYDERLDVVLPYKQQVVAVGTGLGDPRVEIKPIDLYRQQNRTIDISEIETTLLAFVLSYPSKVNIDLPDILESVEGIIESTSGEGEQSEDGTVAFTGDYSISMSLRASAQSSATLLPDVIPGIKQFWGNNIDSTNYQFFLESPIVPADVLTKIIALVGGTVLAWPKYNPELVTMRIVGQRLSLQVVATSQGSAAVSGSGTSSTTAGGTGLSQEAGLTLKTVRISPTIHDEITVTGDTTDSVMISATATAEAAGLGPAEDSTESGTVNAEITPTTIPATVGEVAWPTTGKYLLRVDAEPYRFGFIQFHCIVVDAADFPNN